MINLFPPVESDWSIDGVVIFAEDSIKMLSGISHGTSDAQMVYQPRFVVGEEFEFTVNASRSGPVSGRHLMSLDNYADNYETTWDDVGIMILQDSFVLSVLCRWDSALTGYDEIIVGPYDSSAHSWFQIKISEGTLYFNCSSDGESWNTMHSLDWSGPDKTSTDAFIQFTSHANINAGNLDFTIHHSTIDLHDVPEEPGVSGVYIRTSKGWKLLNGEVDEVEPSLPVFIKSSRGWIPLDAELA